MDKQTKISGREKVYNFLVDYIMENGYAPSIRDICIGTNLNSSSSVCFHLLNLENEGRIKMKKNSPRAIKLVDYEFRKIAD